jgi:hypothetical protein
MTVTAWGPAEASGFIAYLLEAVNHPAWRPGIPALMDFRDLDIGRLGAADAWQVADQHQPYAKILAAAPIAVVVSRPVDFGMVRMWESLVHQMHLAHEVFYAMAEAEAWLQDR